MTDQPCLIVECSEADQWPGLHMADLSTGPRRIPAERRPVALHPDRHTAEREAKRLAEARPGCRFVIFEAVAVGFSHKVPTHITLAGKVFGERLMPIVADLGDGVPF